MTEPEKISSIKRAEKVICEAFNLTRVEFREAMQNNPEIKMEILEAIENKII